MSKISYKKAGVDIRKADKLVRWIKTNNSGSVSSLGSDYASLHALDFSSYKQPVLASSTDGVGTKIELAKYFSSWEGIGQDLLAMCLNDLICVGAKPLFFLDYYACGQLHLSQAKAFLKGLKKACDKANCSLVGGETAELPGFYKDSNIDLAGFCVGIVEKSKILKASLVRKGDDIVAFKSSGFHSNGYSLLRKLYKSDSDLKKNKKILLEPTRLYSFLVPVLNQIKNLRAMAHITGSGLDNLSRILPNHLTAELKAWSIPSCFLDVKKRSALSWKEMLKIFNCGLGLVLILKDKKVLYDLFPQKDIISLGKVRASSQRKAWNLNFKDLNSLN
ncbi:MAG: phosphoribosylformylglycinamidine cyclo-ligase [Bdellovibrionales bacterium]|nr:phosphoribosylformylglycinamidine cyclo-ligase [Bdellovibrionales bacterium]